MIKTKVKHKHNHYIPVLTRYRNTAFLLHVSRELHTEWEFIIIQDSIKTGKPQLQKDSHNTTQSIKTKKRLYTSVIATESQPRDNRTDVSLC